MKKVLIIDNNLPYLINNINYPVGGATVQTLSWIYGFESLKYKIFIGSSIRFNKINKYKIYDTSICENKILIIKIAKTLYKLACILNNTKPDFIYISTPGWANVFILFVSFLKHIKTVQRISNDNLVDFRSKKRFGLKKNFIYKITLRLSTLILCQNKYQYDNITKQYPYKKVIKPTNPFMIKTKPILGKLKRSYIAWIGIFQKQKNMEALYRIAKQLPQLSFKIAGEAYDDIDRNTQEAIKKLKTLDNVYFIGLLSREVIPDFLSKAICLINTSYYEGFSNTYLEAFSVNTPIITRKITDPDSIIENNDLGMVVEDFFDMPKAIIDLIKSNRNYDHLSKYLKKNHDPIMLAKLLEKNLFDNG